MMKRSDSEYRDVIARRDPKYDGRFYFGVTTTRIYCRPVCPARPKPENIIVFKSCSAAEKQGYRPCKRCRPDVAPGRRIHDRRYALVGRALCEIETGADKVGAEALAAKLGVSSRHLRRLFDEYMGASPLEIMNTQKLHLAKQLLLGTAMSITDVAYGAGFGSLRRFNEAFKQVYKVPPGVLRKSNGHAGAGVDAIVLNLMLRQPYDWRYVLDFLRRHCIAGVEDINENSYTRYIGGGGTIGRVRVSLGRGGGHLELKAENIALTALRGVIFNIKKLFDTEHNPAYLAAQPRQYQGIRVPGAYDSFEVAVSVILSQLVSTAQARAKLEQLVLRYGKALENPFGSFRLVLFPPAEVLMHAELESLGMPKVKAHAIRHLAAKVAAGELVLSYLHNIDTVKKQLLEIKGIGPWSAEVIAMRCLGDADAFPRNDLVIKRCLDRDLMPTANWSTLHAYLCHALWRDYAGSVAGLSTRKHHAGTATNA